MTYVRGYVWLHRQNYARTNVSDNIYIHRSRVSWLCLGRAQVLPFKSFFAQQKYNPDTRWCLSWQTVRDRVEKGLGIP
jgi:hypothetical protein